MLVRACVRSQVEPSTYPQTCTLSGMTDNMEGAPFLLEADQGDMISGAVGRDELGMLIASALSMPDSAGKTMEVRRCEAKDARNRKGPMTPAEVTRLFLKQALDRHRWRVGLQPFPVYVPPPAPPTEQRKEVCLPLFTLCSEAISGHLGACSGLLSHRKKIPILTRVGVGV